MRVGVEVGGTFTDLVAVGPDGVTITKVASTPRAPDEGALNALEESGVPFDAIAELAHGSTIATNAVLERKGFRTAFIATAGFGDVLELQRHGRERIYDLRYEKPRPVVERADTFEVAERVLADGSVARPLDTEAVHAALVPALRDGGYSAAAICLLNAYVNPAHELELAAIIREALPEMFVATSSSIAREFREYERASTTTISAYVQPVIDSYIERFTTSLAARGFRGNFSVMQSNGGRAVAEAIRETAVTALLSGPAAGVIGASRQAATSGFANLLTLDIGGTSTDVCAVIDGKPQLAEEYAVDRLPIRVPVIDINTIGAGGGSIVWVDDGRMLRVGPQSAGADPGPACYGRGGTAPTLTDAHVIRRTVRAEAFLGGRMAIDVDASHRVFQDIADRFDMTLEQAADSAVRLANANVVRAIQLISTERGLDPRDFVLLPYGGGGPLHAAAVAEELGIATVVVPPSAGVISAYGLIASDFVQYSSLTRHAPVDDGAAAMLRGVLAEMRAEADDRLAKQGMKGPFTYELIAAMRFVGQAFEVSVSFDPAELATMSADGVRRRFGEEHERVFFFGGDADKPIEFVSFRLGAILPLAERPVLKETHDQRLQRTTVDLYQDGRWCRGTLMSRADLPQDAPLPGPALLEDPTSTLLLPAGWQAVRDDNDNTILTRQDANA